MKEMRIITCLLSTALVVVTAFAVCGQHIGTKLKHGDEGPKDSNPKIALAYVEEGRKGIPDPFMFTHLIYAFADFNEACDGVEIKHPEKLQTMVDLKKKNPNLKVMLGIGGYKREGFCEMSGDKKKRKNFIKQIKTIVDSLGLDGVDLDWEFPTTTNGGHTASPKDDSNYVKLAKDLRKSLGKEKWISYYSYNTGHFIDHKRMAPYVSYVHVSGYNLDIPKKGKTGGHQSPLYSSRLLGQWCVSKSIERHIEFGVPKVKILLGIPFFERGRDPFPSYTDSRLIDKYTEGMHMQWDEEAQAPYYADDEGFIVAAFDDERSIEAKFDFIRANGMPGIFVWNYDSDYDDHRLGKAIERLRK